MVTPMVVVGVVVVVVVAVVTPLGHLRRSTLDHAHTIYPSIHLIPPIFISIHLIQPIYPSIRACYPTIQPDLFSSRRPRHAPYGRRKSRRGWFWPQNINSTAIGGGSRLCWRRWGFRFDEGRLGDKVTTVEMSRGTNLSWTEAGAQRDSGNSMHYQMWKQYLKV